MPFNFWFFHTTPGGHIDGISGDCDVNREKSSGFTCPYGQGAPLSPSPNSRGGSKVEFILRRRGGGMGWENWWMLASPVQVPRKGKGDMEGLSPALQASTGGYRSILEQANQCM